MFHWEPAYTTLLIIAVMVVLFFYRKIPSYIVALLVISLCNVMRKKERA